MRPIEEFANRSWPSEKMALGELRKHGLDPAAAGWDVKRIGKAWKVVPRRSEPAVRKEEAPVVSGVSWSDDLPASAYEEKPEGEAAAASEGEPEALAEGTDLSPLAADRGPYAVRVAAGFISQDRPVLHALEIARKASLGRVEIVDPAGTVARVLVPGLIAPKARTGGASGRTVPDRGHVVVVDKEWLAKEALALATRPEGVRRTDLHALNRGVTLNWKGYLERIGRPKGLHIRVDKSGGLPVYWLEK